METSSPTSTLAFRIHGMDCAEEVAVFNREVGPLVGDQANLAFDILNGKMIVTSESQVSSSVIQQAVARTGMRAEVWDSDKSVLSSAGYWERNSRTALTALSGASLAAAAMLHGLLSDWPSALGIGGK